MHDEETHEIIFQRDGMKTLTAKQETYENRLTRLITALQQNAMDRPATQRLKAEVVAFMREQAKMIVALEAELDYRYGEL